MSEKHSVKEPQQLRLRSQDEKATVLEMGCTSACGPNADTAGLPEGTSTVCDHGCGGGRAPSDSFWYMCGAGDPEKYGSRCRLCFQDEEKAIRMQQILSENEDGSNHEEVIMCDTMRPPEPVGCSSNCLIKSYTVRRMTFIGLIVGGSHLRVASCLLMPSPKQKLVPSFASCLPVHN